VKVKGAQGRAPWVRKAKAYARWRQEEAAAAAGGPRDVSGAPSMRRRARGVERGAWGGVGWGGGRKGNGAHCAWQQQGSQVNEKKEYRLRLSTLVRCHKQPTKTLCRQRGAH
jgi:hypothetical protein